MGTITVNLFEIEIEIQEAYNVTKVIYFCEERISTYDLFVRNELKH